MTINKKPIIQIQKQLTFKKFYSKKITNELNRPTQTSIATFHITHTIKKKDKTTWSIIYQINKNIKQRMTQLQLTLQQLQKSEPLQHELTTYAQMNIPTFTLQLYKNEHKTQKHQIIINNTKLNFNHNN